MKNYLFNKIKVQEDGKVKFVPFRKAAGCEYFMANTYDSENQDIWEFIPNSFAEFLTMLKRTNVDEMGEYKITLCVDGKEEVYSFYSLIDYFASKIYMYNHSMHLSTVGRFITAAYQVKEETKMDQKSLNNEEEADI